MPIKKLYLQRYSFIKKSLLRDGSGSRVTALLILFAPLLPPDIIIIRRNVMGRFACFTLSFFSIAVSGPGACRVQDIFEVSDEMT